MGRGDTFGFFNYNSDDSSTYCIKLAAAVATQGGFSGPADPTSQKVWPFGAKNLRHVYGKSSTGQRDKLPIAANSDTKYVSGGNFTLGGITYTIEGIIGEKRKLNSVS